MKTLSKRALVTLFSCLFLFSGMISLGQAQDYPSLKGEQSVKALFDFRIGNPESALLHLQLIHKTYKDDSIRKVTEKPQFAVVFMDVAVKLLSTDRKGFSPEEIKTIDEIANVISAMSKDGITLEICMFAAHYFKVDPKSVLPELNQVGNGWISSIGYQAKGYSLVPAY